MMSDRTYISFDWAMMKNQMATARGEGLMAGEEKGRVEERWANARSLKEHGVPIDVIAKSLSLTQEETQVLQR